MAGNRTRRLDVETLEVRLAPAGLALLVRDDNVTVTEGRTDVPVAWVRLSENPGGDVQIAANRIGGDGDFQLETSQLVFTAANWDAYQQVFASLAEDADALDGTAVLRLSASGLAAVDVLLHEHDNDGPQGIEVDGADGGVVVPEGRTKTLLVRLQAAPAGVQVVTASVTGPDADLQIVQGGQLQFTAANWDRFQEITIHAAEDADAVDGSAGVSITSSGLAAVNLTAQERDNDLARQVIGQTLVDDFVAQPLISERQSQEFSYFNRLGGDRGEAFNAGQSEVIWGDGYVEARVLNGSNFAGVFESLNQVLSEGHPLNLHAMLPAQILPAWQMSARAVLVEVAGGVGTFKLELRPPDNSLRFVDTRTLGGGAQLLRFDLPASGLENVQLLTWVVEGPAGSFARVQRVAPGDRACRLRPTGGVPFDLRAAAQPV